MKARNGWLFPLMVLAAGSVTVFGCIGIAAITGYLPLAKASSLPMGLPAISDTLGVMAPSLMQLDRRPAVVVVNTTMHAGGEAASAADGASGAPLKPTAVQKKPGPQ